MQKIEVYIKAVNFFVFMPLYIAEILYLNFGSSSLLRLIYRNTVKKNGQMTMIVRRTILMTELTPS